MTPAEVRERLLDGVVVVAIGEEYDVLARAPARTASSILAPVPSIAPKRNAGVKIDGRIVRYALGELVPAGKNPVMWSQRWIAEFEIDAESSEAADDATAAASAIKMHLQNTSTLVSYLLAPELLERLILADVADGKRVLVVSDRQTYAGTTQLRTGVLREAVRDFMRTAYAQERQASKAVCAAEAQRVALRFDFVFVLEVNNVVDAQLVLEFARRGVPVIVGAERETVASLVDDPDGLVQLS